MKKEYKEIDWDDFDYEEENNDFNLDTKLNIGDCFLFDFRESIDFVKIENTKDIVQ